MNIEAFIDRLFEYAEARGLKEYQVSYAKNENSDIQVFNQEIFKQSDNTLMVLSFAVRVNGKIGRFTTERFDIEDVKRVVDEAVANAEIMECDEEFFFYDGAGNYPMVVKHRPQVERLEKFDKIAFLKRLEKETYVADKRVNKVISTQYYSSLSQAIMRNSLGLNLKDETIRAGAYVYASAQNGSEVKTYGDGVCFDKEEDFNSKRLAEKVVKKLVSRLGAENTFSRKAPVVFENKVFASILGSIYGMFSSYAVDTGKSKLAGKIGELIASPKVSIIDNPWLENGFATSAFDSEGVPTQYKELVKDGVLQGFLYGLSMAHKHHTQSTGNGTGGLGSRVFNFYLKNGTCPREELLRKLGDGVYIDKLNGLSGSISLVSGNFSMGAEGYRVTDGKLGAYLNQFTISGNIYDVLKDIEEIGDDLDFDCSPLGSPSVLVKNITVANN